MNKTNLYSRIQDTEKEISHLVNSLFTLKTTDISQQPDNFQSLSINIALRAERIACQLRSFVFTTASVSKVKYMSQAHEEHNIHITYENEILEVQIPGLLPKRQIRSNIAFLNDPLHYAFQNYLTNGPLPIFDDCVICFTQVYDRDLQLHRIRDYDNIEFKPILDTISAFILHDDSGIHCDTHYTTKLGEQDCTLIHIMNKNMFSDWLKGFSST
jgi:hypothetical protein